MALVGLALLAGCTFSRPAQVDKSIQERARAQMLHKIEALPGATIHANVASSLDGGQGNVGVQARLPVAATEAQFTAIADSIERIIWLSHLDPLGRITVNLVRTGSKAAVLQRLYQDAIDTRELRAKYGPRPNGLPG
jgi:hypothetical protein